MAAGANGALDWSAEHRSVGQCAGMSLEVSRLGSWDRVLMTPLSRADTTGVLGFTTRVVAAWVGLAAVLAGFFVWPSWVSILVPGGALMILASAHWKLRWVVRPWPGEGQPPLWVGRALGICLAIWLAAGTARHLR